MDIHNFFVFPCKGSEVSELLSLRKHTLFPL